MIYKINLSFVIPAQAGIQAGWDFSQVIICWKVAFRFFNELLRFLNVTVFCECLFRPYGELLFFACPKNK